MTGPDAVASGDTALSATGPTAALPTTGPDAADAHLDTGAGPDTGRAPDAVVAAPRRRIDRVDAGVAATYTAAAVVLLGGLWSNPRTGYLTFSVSDQNLWEWFFAFVAHAVSTGSNPFFTTLQNEPLGVNLMANTVMFGLSVPLTPLTLLAGPTATWTVVLTLGLAGTALAWYWLFSRHLVTHRGAAALGGAVAGFSPPVISHANAHPNWVVGFVLPALVIVTLRVARGRRPVRDGVLLGLLVVFQVFLGEELLFIGAVAGMVAAVVWLASRPDRAAALWRPLAAGFAVAAAVALVLLAVPLWWQFAGPQSYRGLPHSTAGNPLDSFTAFATQSLAGVPQEAADLSINRTEENAFLGWPLVVLLIAIVVLWRRDTGIRTLGIAAFVLCVLSLGSTVVVGGVDTGIPLPWELLRRAPLFDTMLTTRFTFGALPMIAALLALATDRVLAAPDPVGPAGRVPLRGLWIAALVAALLPIVPLPLPTTERAPAPAFFTGGAWRSWVDPGGTVVPVPLVDSGEVQPLHWQTESDMGWSMPGGYFVGPGSDGRQGTWGAPARMTSELFSVVRRNERTVVINDAVRAQFVADLRYWRADVLVLVPGDRTDALRTVVDALVGPRGRLVDGALVWDVRDLTR